MKYSILLLIIIALRSFSFSQHNYKDSILKARSEHEANFLKNVLDSNERAQVKALCYFDVNMELIVKANFKRVKGKKFYMPMSKERKVYYRKYGELSFEMNGKQLKLDLFENLSLRKYKEYKNYIFMPFRDLTNSVSTYGGGRYIDIYKQESDIWIIDFNSAYHPYCAYSYRYSCPIVPLENKLDVEINAGECLNVQH